jgi:hypothetical protein
VPRAAPRAAPRTAMRPSGYQRELRTAHLTAHADIGRYGGSRSVIDRPGAGVLGCGDDPVESGCSLCAVIERLQIAAVDGRRLDVELAGPEDGRARSSTSAPLARACCLSRTCGRVRSAGCDTSPTRAQATQAPSAIMRVRWRAAPQT